MEKLHEKDFQRQVSIDSQMEHIVINVTVQKSKTFESLVKTSEVFVL